jgi:uncharacterized membrane protein
VHDTTAEMISLMPPTTMRKKFSKHSSICGSSALIPTIFYAQRRTDTDDLLHSAAQSNASKRLSEEERRIQALVTKLDEVRAELDASQERATVYHKLQREHQINFQQPDKGTVFKLIL